MFLQLCSKVGTEPTAAVQFWVVHLFSLVPSQVKVMGYTAVVPKQVNYPIGGNFAFSGVCL